MRPIWSLMYEWWIYLLFGGLYFFKSNKIWATLLITAGAYYTLWVNPGSFGGHIWLIWALGGTCAYLQQKILWNDLNNRVLDVLSFLFLLNAGVFYYISKNAYNLPAGIFLSLFLFIATCRPSAFLKRLLPLKNVAQALAGLSFTFFLTHYTILTYTKEYLKLEGWSGLIVGFLISSLAAFLIALFTEYRLQKIKAFLSRAGQSALLFPR